MLPTTSSDETNPGVEKPANDVSCTEAGRGMNVLSVFGLGMRLTRARIDPGKALLPSSESLRPLGLKVSGFEWRRGTDHLLTIQHSSCFVSLRSAVRRCDDQAELFAPCRCDHRQEKYTSIEAPCFRHEMPLPVRHQ